jgi:small redox-active disulfide protein 2
MAKHVVKVLGKGCGACWWTERLVREVVTELGADVQVDALRKGSERAAYGVAMTPAVVIDGVVVHAGGIPSKGDVEGWIRSLP